MSSPNFACKGTNQYKKVIILEFFTVHVFVACKNKRMTLITHFQSFFSVFLAIST